ncbi:peptide chain release factor N(5)-glutamine methyltransferase [Flavobacterium sp. J372]|uniref:peptide chain release factor N(5)-glutamine methyltransferase n=1 Tax=Flavobacterium sp. J372 TaxID=2898436 RepID=UPI002150D69F|nr:peptide chain release factor N(5)-glutamine methyltransferase [Flavobacterium sp. J372]MCR5861731.1 peptide chain release factor N(5)-glutamine methyltransferase [Flavobacterium sp. J372]
MKIKDYRTYFLQKLSELYDAMEAENFFAITLEELKRWKRIDVAINPDYEMTGNEIEKWSEVLSQLEAQRPIQYIFGKAHFYGLEFKVNENTLIPRPETEELVEWVINDIQNPQYLKILDIGTGSGCIAISIAKNLKGTEVSAIDVSEEALAVAKENARKNDVDIYFHLLNILEAESFPQKYDIIVSNPPYVRHLEKAEIKPNVLEHEPHLALFVEDNDPLLFYRKIARLAKKYLKPDGRLYFEINQYLGQETLAMLEAEGFKNIVLRKDLMGNDRMIRSFQSQSQ